MSPYARPSGGLSIIGQSGYNRRMFKQLFPAKVEAVPTGWKHIVCFSGGESSALTAIEVSRRYGTKDLVLLNHDIAALVEEHDIKRFKWDVAKYLQVKITFANMEDWDTQTQFDVVIREGAFKNPNTGDALCTSRMKTRPFQEWLKTNIPDQHCVIYYGFDLTEKKRINRRKQIMGIQGWRTDYPLALWDRTISAITEVGIKPPSVYGVFRHANCTGCLKAGVQHWYVVYVTRKDIWKRAKQAEEEIGYSILKDGFLKDLECKFALMRKAGVPATERVPSAQFWRATKAVIGNYLQQHAEEMPCDCLL